MRIDCSIARIEKLSAAEKRQMFNLHGRYFCHVVRQTFLADLEAKTWAIVLRQGPDIVGFSTLALLHRPCAGEMRHFIFSGDTIVDKAYWQSSAMAGSFGHFMLRMLAEHKQNLFWFLISKGYRTYRFLPVFFNCFYPVHDAPTPALYQRLLDLVAVAKYGNAYDPASGIIHMYRKKDWLRPAMRVIPASRQADPHVRFFLRKNPTFAAGDELACITPVAKANLNKFAWRVIGQNSVRWDE